MMRHNHNSPAITTNTNTTEIHYPGRMQQTTQRRSNKNNKWNYLNRIIKIYGCMIVLLLIQIHVWLFQQQNSSSIMMIGNNSNNHIIRKKKRYNYDFDNDPTRVTFDKYPEYYNKNNNNKHYNLSTTTTSSNKTTTPGTKSITTTTVIVYLRGELGNHLSSIAHGRGIQLWLLENYGIESHMLFQQQTFVNERGEEFITPKSLPTLEKIHNCFPQLRLWDFRNRLLVDTNELQHAQKQQSQNIHLTAKETKILSYINGRKRSIAIKNNNMDPFVIQRMDMKQSLDVFQHALQQLKQQQQQQQPSSSLSHHGGGGGGGGGVSMSGSNSTSDRISIPFLYSDSLDNLLLIDHYLDHFQNDLFEFDHARCCGSEQPEEDESIFHYRNFATELTQGSRGLQETTPNQTSNILFGHLKAGSKVAITSRFNNDILQKQVDELQLKKGLYVRIIMNNQSPMEDFCFLLQAKKELIGNFQSTFVFWAGILGTSKVKFYTINSRVLQNRYGGGGGGSNLLLQAKFLYNFTNPKLHNRIQLQLIDEEEEG